MKFVECTDAYEPAYRDFLRKVGGSSEPDLRLPFAYYGTSPGIAVKRHLLIDDTAAPELIVGAVSVKLQTYVVRGREVQVAVATYPNSRGLVEPRYAMASILLFRKLAEAYPFNILLGMGPPDRNVTSKMCAMLGWKVLPIPYLFMPRRLGPLAAKQLAHRPWLARLARLAGRLGVLWPAESILRRRAIGRPARRLRVAVTPRFDSTLDAWWRAWSGEIGFSLVRDSEQMNAMFPETETAFEKLAFHDGERLVGFAVLLVPPAASSEQRTGVNLVTLVEFSLLPAFEAEGAAALAEHLFARRLDAVIANTPHAATLEALKAHGFRERVTNVYLAVSRPLQALLDENGVSLQEMVITRGDGDGPIGLGADL